MNYNFPCMHEMGSCSSGSCNFLQGVMMNSCSVHQDQIQGFDYDNVSTISMAADAKIAASNKSHSEAERRRRKRINAHLSTLRTLVSNTIKGDKASLLEEVVRSIKELKKSTGEVIKGGAGCDVEDLNIQKIILPTETDEVEVCYSEQDSGSGMIKASLCCDDRPEILGDIKRALSSVEAKVVRAEMGTVGGRTKAVLWLQLLSSCGGGGGGGGGCGGGSNYYGEEEEGKLRRALKIVIDKSILLPGSAAAHSLPGYNYKRPRLYHS